MTNNEIKKDELQETTAYKDFCKIHDYLTSNKYISQRDRAVDFYYGNQWGAVTENTKNVPRPVFNICKLQINNKQSNIVSVPVAIKFFTNNSAQEGDTRLVTSFAKYLFIDSVLKLLGMDLLKELLFNICITINILMELLVTMLVA